MRMLDRTAAEWLMDISGLFVQSVAVPAAAIYLASVCRGTAPRYSGALHFSWAWAFLLNFVVVDYLYYWNHRLLHGPLWRWHAAHHTAKSMDVLITSRNTLWTPILIVYIWANAAFLYLLADPTPYLAAVAVSSLLDVWRHSGFGRFSNGVLITPADHSWHHGSGLPNENFGANFALWDRLHGTYRKGEAPKSLGLELEDSLWKKLVMP
ncbi:MAG: sterol desaturase family protein [Elusimicrobia bacterium]|nr:sterol desaturase family protein [Elusimicrobiota bacterium]